MKILLLSNLYPNPIQQQRTPWQRQQMRALAATDQVRVVAPVAWTDEMHALLSNGKRLPRGRRCELDGLLIDHPRYVFPPGMLFGMRGPLFRWSINTTFRAALAEFRPDVIHSAWAYPDGWTAIRYAREIGIPAVVKVVGSDILSLREGTARMQRTREVLQAADALVAVSEDLRNRIIALGAPPSRIHVVKNGIDVTAFQPGSRNQARQRLGLDLDAPLILFAGNLVPVKRVDVLIEACARLKRTGVNFSCRILGSGPLQKRLERQINTAGLESHVVLQGSVPHTDLPVWIRAANVVALTSRSEGIPNILLEAKACHRPFVASRVGGIPEIADARTSRLTEVGDAAGVAAAIADFLPDRTLAATDFESADLITWAESAARLRAVFQEVLQRNRMTGGPSRQHSHSVHAP